MIKHASIFKLTLPSGTNHQILEDAAQRMQFVPCALSQERSFGWAPPRGQEHGELVECVDGHYIMQLMTETRSVPGKALDQAVEEKCKAIEDGTGRKVGKKERRELKENLRLERLPMAFPNRYSVLIWMFPKAGILVIGSATSGKVDAAVTSVVQLVEGLSVEAPQTTSSPTAVMSDWLVNDADLSRGARFGFDIDRSCELTAADESKAKVRYSNHSLQLAEIREHITKGKLPTKLSLTYEERVSVTLTEKGVLTGIKFLDGVFMDRPEKTADEFDGNMAILTGEMTKVIDALIQALGGQPLEID